MKNFSILNCFVIVIAFSTGHASVRVSLAVKGFSAAIMCQFKAAKILKRSHHHHNEKTDTSWFEHGLNLMLGMLTIRNRVLK